MAYVLMALAIVMIAYIAKYTRLHMTDNDPEEFEIVKKEMEVIKNHIR